MSWHENGWNAQAFLKYDPINLNYNFYAVTFIYLYKLS